MTGALARGEDARGICQRQQCRRSCWIDPADLVERGLGGVPMGAIERSLKCNHLEGCGMEFIRTPPQPSLALAQILGLNGVTVEIMCGSCRQTRRVTPQALRDGLPKAQRGKVRYLADVEPLLKSACEKCGKTDWKLHPRWPRRVCRGNGWVIE